MRPVIAWPMAIVLSLLTVGAYFNGDSVNDWIRDHSITIDSQEKGPLVGVSDHEVWLFVLIDFPDQEEAPNCNQQRASNLIDDNAIEFLNQGIGPNSTLEIVYHDRIVTTDFGMADYGHDVNGENDVGRNGVNPHTLAQEIVLEIEDEVEWAKFDINSDGWIDRFLILHCIKPQEDGGGSSSRIWSHFSSIEETVELPGDLKISHYTISSQYSSKNFGTVMHEMYHQLGAADLYQVDDVTVNQNWKGVGKWDIMASGNLNGNGAWPALPTSPSIELIGGERHHEIELEWLPGSDCSGPVFEFNGLSEGGTSLKIPIDDEEYIWIEYRSDFGFDSHLPGNGILVLQQDLRSGDVEDNLVNAHPERAWLKVIEADGEQNMVAGNNDGEATDLFWEDDQFGSEGIQIRNRDGVLVDWIANVSVDQGLPSIEFSSLECGHGTEVDLPDYGSILRPSDSIKVVSECSGINFDLTSSDGRNIIVSNDEIVFSTPGMVGVIGNIVGTISCDEGTPVDIVHEFEIVGNIPVQTKYEGTIPTAENSTIEIPVELVGGGSQMWLVGIDGPLSRIASTDVNQKLSIGSVIILEINPADLLSDGTLINGEIILASDSGHKYSIQIELIAGENEETFLKKWSEPAKLVPIALALATIWVVLGIDSSARKVATDKQEIPVIPQESDNPAFVDPFS